HSRVPDHGSRECRPMMSIRTLTFATTIALPALLFSGVSDAQTPPPDQPRVIHLSAANSRTTQRIPIGVNQAVMIELDRDVRDVIVANPLIADAVVKAPRRIFIMSLKPGQTSALFVDAQGTQIANL